MIRWHVRCILLNVLCAIGALGLLLGCEADVSDNCGGAGDDVSCLNISSIDPVDSNGTTTSNVDAVRGVCDGNTPEPFTDHYADVTLVNTDFSADTLSTLSIIITDSSVTYTLNDCPPNASGCPALTGFSVSPGQTITIPPGGSVTTQFPFVPLRVKDEYVAEGGEVTGSATGAPFPSYTVNYVFTGHTDSFGADVQLHGAAEFTIGNFNLCGTQ